jgi:FKBP-type peptidyl-prolyl cis-trans isomerase (trigger factor)
MSHLLGQVECELPEELVRGESQRLLSEIVRENQSRGVPEEVIREKQAELIASAGESARDRLKGVFILSRIAEAEKISVTREEFDYRVAMMATRYKMPVDKLRKQLDNAGALEKVQEEILTAKVLDFLASSVSVTASAPEAAPEAP